MTEIAVHSSKLPSFLFHQRMQLLVVFVVAFSVRALFGIQPIDYLDKLFVPDDTYYTLSIARSLGNGLGPMSSGGVLTNGFQPLLAFLVAPFAWAGLEGDQLLRVAIFLGVVSGGISSALLVVLTKQLIPGASNITALLVGMLWACSPVSLAIDLCGLESSLALSANLLVIVAFLQRPNQIKQWCVLGLLVGIALLSRVDSAILVLVFGVRELVWGDRKGIVVAAMSAFLIVAPWWGYSFWVFGTPIPESGQAVRHLTFDHQAVHLSLMEQISWSVGYIAPGPLRDMPLLREWLSIRSIPTLFLFCGLHLLLLSSRIPVTLRVVAVTLIWFYTFYVPALWFFQRYFYLVMLIWLMALLSQIPARFRVITLVSALVVSSVGLWRLEPSYGLHGTKGYRQPILEVIEHLPKSELVRVGAMQSGALGFYAPANLEVHNLDGVVNRHAATAIRDKNLSQYIRTSRIDWIVDWPFNLNAITRFSRESPPINMQLIHKVSPQGHDQFLITRVDE